MRKLFTATAALALTQLAVVNAATYPATLAGCLAFAALFDNTCTDLSTATDFDSVPSETVTCTGDVAYCAGSWDSTGSTCTWTRKLCVTCSTTNSVTYIRIQTNSLPNRCYYAGKDTPVSQSFDFKVKFNWDASSQATNTAVTSVSTADTANCDTSMTLSTKIPSNAKFTNSGTKTLDAVGVALDGLLINAGINADQVDDFYPPSSYGDYTYANNNQSYFDHCMSHTNGDGYYHYHAPSPCVGNTALQGDTPYRCYSVSSCWGLYMDYIHDNWPTELTVFGLAKDGHIIWGPYDDNGDLFDACDLDYCNGATIDGVYGYAATAYHPYLPSCYGPATSRGSYQQECTSNAPYCSSSLLSQTRKSQFRNQKRLTQRRANAH